MIILLPIKLSQTGGTSIFARKFQASMAKLGHTVTFDFRHDYDALLVPAVCPLRYLLHAKLASRSIIHRLDGVYYSTTIAGRWWRWYNLPLKIIHRYFATATIFQSRYSQFCAEKFLGHTNQPSTIIYNGIDIDHFTPQGPAKQLRLSPDERIVITWSRFRRADQLLPAIQTVAMCRKKFRQNIKFVVIGNFETPLPSSPKALLKLWGYAAVPDWIRFIGPINNDELPEYARAADVFLFTHANPPCPNNVLEAMACGLPICGVADGAMSEITQPGHNSELAAASGGGFMRQRSYNVASLARNLNLILSQPTVYTESRRLAVNHFALSKMANYYITFINQQSLATPPHR